MKTWRLTRALILKVNSSLPSSPLTSNLPPGPDSPSPPCSPLPTMLPSEEEEGAPVPRYSAKFTDNVTKVRGRHD